MGTPSQNEALGLYESLRGKSPKEIFGIITTAGYTGGVEDPELREKLESMVSHVNRMAVEGAGLKGDERISVVAGVYVTKLREMIDPEIIGTVKKIRLEASEV